MLSLQSPLLSSIPGIDHGFGTRAEPLPALFQSDWETRRARWQQVHKTDSARIQTPGEHCGEVDALFSSLTQVPVAVMSADCVPILLAREDGGKVAAVHAGWRGTRARILQVLIRRLMKEDGEKPSRWLAAIGPAIGPCCYEVSPEIAADFETEFEPYGKSLAVPRPRFLDLAGLNARQLLDAGLAQDRIEVLRHCTRCENTPEGQPRFFSYRREGSGTRQWSVIWRQAGSPE